MKFKSKHIVSQDKQLDAAREAQRRRLLAFLRNDAPAWREEDHPELKDGVSAWVKKIRSEGEARMNAMHRILENVPNLKSGPGDELE